MFGKKKNTDDTAVKTPKSKLKKAVKIIIVIVCALLAGLILIGIFAGDSDENKSLYPSLDEYVAEYIDYYDEAEKDDYVLVWYLIDEEDLPELEKYEEGITEDYDFESVDGGDDDYYFRYTGEKEIAPLFSETNNQEYHVRVGVGDDKIDGRSLICLMYSKDFKEESVGSADKESSDDSETNSDSDDEKATSGKDEVLVEPLNFDNGNSGKQSKDSVKFQSLFDFASGDMSFDKVSQSGYVYSQSFKGDEEDIELIDEYAKLLCKDGMNFKERDSIFEDYRDFHSSYNDLKIYASWFLDYTGTSSVKDSCEYDSLGKSGSCSVEIYYAMNRTTVKGYIKWSADLDSTDLGFRNGGKTETIAPGGKSAGAGLIKTADGKYETTDGRFSVGFNEAMAIVGGDSQKYSVEFVDYETASDLIKIKDADGKNQFVVFLSCEDPVKTGTVYNMTDLAQEYQHVSDSDPGGPYNYEKPRVYQRIKDSWLTPGLEDNSVCQDATLRIVYYNKDENVAAFYIYTDLKGGSEAFCVVDLSKALSSQNNNSSSGGSGSGSSSSGFDSDFYTKKDKTCSYCGGSGYVTCTTCGGKGYYVARGSTPNYAGSIGGGGAYEEYKPCTGIRCEGGKKKCLHCNF
ncbi:MAG: hypothetical protein IJZ88_05055 [Clostridia bacterium]|nr:hypothetical protein [Clostridia bacterium]